MLECLVLGDSVAVGVAQHRPECVKLAHTGWNTARWSAHYLDGTDISAGVVVISLGGNDRNISTLANLHYIRKRVSGHKVYWILPSRNNVPAAEAVLQVAAQYGDVVLPRPQQHMSSDKVHPTQTGYKLLAKETKQ
jgi:hypothetical protein